MAAGGREQLENGQAAALRLAQAIGYMRQAPVNAVVQVSVASGLCLLLWEHVPTGWLCAWYAFLAVVSVDLARRWWEGRHKPITRMSRRGIRRAVRLAVVTGLVWGSAGLYLGPLPPMLQAGVFILIAGMAGGAATTLSPMPAAATGYLAATLLPLIVRLFTLPTVEHHVVGMVTVVYLIALLFATRAVYRTFHEGFFAEWRSAELLREARTQRDQWLRMSDQAEGYALLDAERRLVLWNTSFQRMFGLVQEPPVGAEYVELLRGSIGPYAPAPDAEAMERWIGEQLRMFAYPDVAREQRLADGRWLRTTVRRTGDGGTLVAHIDITSLKQRESELIETHASLEARTDEVRTAYAQLELQNRLIEEAAQDLAQARDVAQRANEAKSVFLANMSHELRTPLNAIIGFSEIMEQELFGALGSEKYKDYIGDIGRSGRHLLSIINDILDMSKIEARRMELIERELDLAELLAECERVLAPQAATRKVSLAVEIEPASLWLYADATRMRQIVINLLSNAIKFTTAGSRVLMRAGIVKDGGCAIAIVDQGCGMTSEEIEIALLPFRQLSGAYAREHEGTGLGLPLAKALVALHGGSLEIDSTPGTGTTVTVLLPATRLLPEPKVRASA